MKLIEKKGQKKVPELIWGAKYKVIAPETCDDIEEGETVVLVSTKVDFGGYVQVFSENDWDYFKPEQLQLITDETTEKSEPTYVIEFTESELQAVVLNMGEATGGYVEYSKLADILQGEDK